MALFRGGDPYYGGGIDVPARAILDRAAASLREELDDEPQLQAWLMFHIGQVYGDLGELDVARPMLEEAVALERETRGPGSLQEAIALDALAEVLRRKGEYAPAEEAFRRVLDIHAELGGEEHRAFATTLNNLGNLLQELKRWAEAERTLRRALEVYQAIGDQDREAREELATARANLAYVLVQLGRPAEAEAPLLEALDELTRLHGDSHLALVAPLNTLGMLRKHQGDFAGGEEAYLEALELRRRNFPAEGVDDAVILFNSYKLRLAAGKRDEEAESRLRHCLEVLERAAGPDHPNTVMVRGELERFQVDGGGN